MAITYTNQLKAENESLKAENESLKAEIESLRSTVFKLALNAQGDISAATHKSETMVNVADKVRIQLEAKIHELHPNLEMERRTGVYYELYYRTNTTLWMVASASTNLGISSGVCLFGVTQSGLQILVSKPFANRGDAQTTIDQCSGITVAELV